jgi:hypothetical protein
MQVERIELVREFRRSRPWRAAQGYRKTEAAPTAIAGLTRFCGAEEGEEGAVDTAQRFTDDPTP